MQNGSGGINNRSMGLSSTGAMWLGSGNGAGRDWAVAMGSSGSNHSAVREGIGNSNGSGEMAGGGSNSNDGDAGTGIGSDGVARGSSIAGATGDVSGKAQGSCGGGPARSNARAKDNGGSDGESAMGGNSGNGSVGTCYNMVRTPTL